MAAIMVALVFIGIVVLAIPLFILQGIALKVLWGWFLVPLGAPVITTSWAIGISIVVSLLTKQYQYEPKDAKNPGWHLWAYAVANPLMSLGIGWALHHWWPIR